MNLINLDQLASFINKRGIEAKTIVERPEVSVRNLELKPEENIESHTVNVYVTFVVLRGSGKIKIGEEIFDVVSNNIVLCEPGIPMEIFGGKEGMSFLNIKTPNPDN